MAIPQSKEREAASVWQVKVLAHDAVYHLTQVGFAGGELSLSKLGAVVGSVLRVQIYARDVSITLETAKETSILNVLPALINDIAETGENGQTVVRLQVGDQLLLAHISCKSAHLLNLQIGMKVYAQIKGTSILN